MHREPFLTFKNTFSCKLELKSKICTVLSLYKNGRLGGAIGIQRHTKRYLLLVTLRALRGKKNKQLSQPTNKTALVP